MRAEAGDVETETRAIADSSVARALHALAEREKATLIVIGSSHRGSIGRVLAGTTAERLLHGSPCPVAVVPRSHAQQPGAIRSILVAYDGSAEAKAALYAAMTAGRALSAAVRVVRVLEPASIAALNMTAASGYVTPAEEIEREAREAFDADIAALPNQERLLAEFVVGDPADELAERSQAADLLVTGSRGYGAMRAVLLGSVSRHLVRAAACPVIVVPRGVDSHFEQLFVAPSSSCAA
jgi:nucleotide-binding universal stress UspA family protein